MLGLQGKKSPKPGSTFPCSALLAFHRAGLRILRYRFRLCLASGTWASCLQLPRQQSWHCTAHTARLCASPGVEGLGRTGWLVLPLTSWQELQVLIQMVLRGVVRQKSYPDGQVLGPGGLLLPGQISRPLWVLYSFLSCYFPSQAGIIWEHLKIFTSSLSSAWSGYPAGEKKTSGEVCRNRRMKCSKLW